MKGDTMTETPRTAAQRLSYCTKCGSADAAGFHPYWHCVLVKAGLDPRHLDPPDPAIEAAQDAARQREELLVAQAMAYQQTGRGWNKLTDSGREWWLGEAALFLRATEGKQP